MLVRHYVRRSALLLTMLLSSPIHAQGTREDYQRADSLRQRWGGKVFRDQVRPQWDVGGERFWYRNDLAEGQREFVRVDGGRGTRELAFDHQRLAQTLSKTLNKPIDASRLPIEELAFLDKEAGFRLLCQGQWWACDQKTYTLTRSEAPSRPATPSATPRRPQRTRFRGGADSPDGQWTTLVRDGNLLLRPRAQGEAVALSTDGKPQDGFTGEVYWSPDSRYLVAVRRKNVAERKIHLIESSPRDQLQPKLIELNYAKPGDALSTSTVALFNLEQRKPVPLDASPFPTPWEIGEIRWDRDSKRFTFFYNQRGHQVLRVLGVEASTGKVVPVVDEQSKTFLDYAHKRYSQYLEETQELIWMSERDGWNHLYLYDLKTGRVKNQITRGPWVVRAVERVDVEKRQIWFQAGGIQPGQDPYFLHHARVNFDGTGLVLLTEGNGTHTITWSPDRRYLLDTYSRVDLAPVTELRRADDGKKICDLEKADTSLLTRAGWKAPEAFVARGRDGKTDIYGVLFKPSNFDPQRQYPVVENIYAGPQGAFVPKSFRAVFSHQAMAELGFIVVQIDGMGTSYRSKAFHDVCWKNLGDAGFPDRILWLKAAASTRPWMDLARVGIYGGSAGGQSTVRGLLAHGEFYKVGVADCGCHDNRMDKVWWNELWMGWPIGPHYAEQSNVTQAHRLQGKLLLIVGELDRNVDPASTLQVVNALVKANRDFDMLIIPGAGHGAAESPYGQRRRMDFLVRHLHGVEPRRER